MPRPRRSSRSRRVRSVRRPTVGGPPRPGPRTAVWRSPWRFCLGLLTRPTRGSTIHRMMTSSSDELLQRGVEPVLVVENLRVVRGKRPAIHDLSVQIARGSITGLLGPSGCVKTTLMRSILGTQIITAVSVTLLGHPAGSAPLRKCVGYMPQDATIYDDLPIVDNVPYFEIGR